MLFVIYNDKKTHLIANFHVKTRQSLFIYYYYSIHFYFDYWAITRRDKYGLHPSHIMGMIDGLSWGLTMVIRLSTLSFLSGGLCSRQMVLGQVWHCQVVAAASQMCRLQQEVR